MEYKFKYDIDKWIKNQQERINKINNKQITLSPKQVFFESKFNEIYLRYKSARTMVSPIDNNRYDYWYKTTTNNKENDFLRLNYNGFFLENMIMNYLTIIDLSRVLAFHTMKLYYCEINFNETNKIEGYLGDIKDISYIDDKQSAKKILDSYSKMSPEFEKIVNHLEILTLEENSTYKDLRYLYNFLKHEGKPEYKEIYDLLNLNNLNYKVPCGNKSVDSGEKRLELSLYDTLYKVLSFDDDTLYLYFDKLINLILEIVY